MPTTPSGNQSVSGTVGASIIGQLPAGTAPLGSVAVLQGTNPWNISSIYGNISGSVLATISGTPNVNTAGSVVAFQGGAWTPSISGTVGASIIGLPPVRISDGTDLLDIYEENQIDTSVVGLAMMFRSNANTSLISVVSPTTPLPASVQGNVNVGGSVVAFQGTGWSGSVAATITNTNVNISGSVVSYPLGTVVTSLVSTIPSSVIVGSSIFGQLPAGVAVLGSIATLQGTSPWNIAGSVLAVQGTWSGSVVSQQLGTRISSVVGSIPSSLLTGIHGHRNDAIASYLGGNLSWRPIATDSAGRSVIKPFAPEESRLDAQTSVVSTSVTALFSSAIGLRNYLTDFFVANTGSVATLITFTDGSTSVLGYTIAPATGGSNAPGISMPLRTAPAQDFRFQAGTAVSILYMTAKGYQAP